MKWHVTSKDTKSLGKNLWYKNFPRYDAFDNYIFLWYCNYMAYYVCIYIKGHEIWIIKRLHVQTNDKPDWSSISNYVYCTAKA